MFMKKRMLQWGLCVVVLGMTLTLMSTLAQEVPAAADPAVAEAEGSDNSVFTLILQGGPVMIPLAIFSIIALTVTFERAVSMRRDRMIPRDFLSGLKGSVDGSFENVEKAILYCESKDSPVGRIFKSGLMHADRGMETVEKSIEDAGGREVDKLKRSLRGLAIVASVAPLLGLLGTVYGMIGAFKRATEKGMGDPTVLASGIYEALVTTATGLTIAVPALLIYQYFDSRVDALVDEIDDLGIDFMHHLFKQDKVD
jgi:biopolymer transport protein ExbB